MPEYTDHHGPAGLRTRGTIVIVPGRGETRTTYDRLGRRLSADAYRVRVVDAPWTGEAESDLGAWVTGVGELLTEAVERTATEDGVAHPVVFVGADTGAAAIAALLGGDSPAARLPQAVVLAGLPGGAGTASTTWEEELDVRTSCPVHRSVLSEDAQVRRGALAETVPEALPAAAHAAGIAVPALYLVGDADPLADRDALTRAVKSQPRARLSVVRDAHHDVLNDMQHRSVAAEIVTFLETLRNDLVPVVAVESSAW